MIGTKYLAWLVAGTTAFLGPSTSRTCPPESPTGSAEGDVVVIAASTDDGAGTDYLAFLDLANETGITNGQADRVFRLQTTEKNPGQFSSWRLDGASVEWRRGAVEIKTASEEMTLALEEQAGIPNSRDILGYGLSNMAWRVDIPERPTLEWYFDAGGVQCLVERQLRQRRPMGRQVLGGLWRPRVLGRLLQRSHGMLQLRLDGTQVLL